MPSPLTQRDRDLLKMPSIASQMPVHFENKALWSSLKGSCQGCGHELPDDLMRGHVARQTPHMASVEAVGLCRTCRLATRFTYRLYDDMRIVGLSNGKWVTWTWGKRRPGLLARLRTLAGF